MAINMMCMNSACKYYWEDNCTRNMNEERIEIGEDGKCETFEAGVSDWYVAMEDCKAEYEESLKLDYDPCDICPNNQIDTCVYIEENDRESCEVVGDWMKEVSDAERN